MRYDAATERGRLMPGVVAAVLLGACAMTAWGVDAVELGPAPTVDGANPYTGRVSAVACSRTDPNRYFVAGADGGVWRTTDGGASWTPLTDFMPTTSMGALAIDPINENNIYAGTGEANYANHCRYGLGIFKSTDGGDTWVQLAEETFAGRTFSRLVVNPDNPQVLYGAVAAAGGFPALAAAKLHPGRYGPMGIFRSEDGGTTWTQLLNGLPNDAASDVAIDPSDPTTVYAAIGNVFGAAHNGIYKSVDGGASWTKLEGGLPTTSVGRITIAVAPSMPQRLYTLYNYPADSSGGGAYTRGALRSDDGGASWTELDPGSIQSSYGWYLSVVTVQPTNPDVVFMGGLDLYRSDNAGASWVNVGPPHVDQHAAEWDAAGRLVAGNDGGVHRSANLGNLWTALNTGLGLIQFYAGISTHPTNDDYILGGTQDNGSNIRDEDSQEWIQVYGGDGGWTQINPATPTTLFVEYQGTGNLYRSLNGGSSFSWSGSGITTTDRNCFLPPYVIDHTNPTRMYYCTHKVYRSTNGGSSWVSFSGDLTEGGSAAIRSLAMAPSDSSILYVATNDGNIWRRIGTWEKIALDIHGWPRTTREIFIHPTDPLTAYVAVGVFGEAQIRRTVPSERDWWQTVNSPADIPINVVAVDVRGSKPIIYAGADNGLYRTINDGATWHRYGRGLPHSPVIDLRLEVDRQRMIVGTQGRGAWQVAIGLPGDCDCDGVVSYADIDYFVEAINGEQAWQSFYAARHEGAPPPCHYVSCDLTGDGVVGYDDIDPFVEALGG